MAPPFVSAVLHRFPVERRRTPDLALLIELIPPFDAMCARLAAVGLPRPPSHLRLWYEGQKIGQDMLADLTVPDDPATASRLLTRHFQPIIDLAILHLSQARDALWQAERDDAIAPSSPAMQVRAALLERESWERAEYTLAAWEVFAAAIRARSDPSVRGIEQKTVR